MSSFFVFNGPALERDDLAAPAAGKRSGNRSLTIPLSVRSGDRGAADVATAPPERRAVLQVRNWFAGSR
jgi:hypothetical protein